MSAMSNDKEESLFEDTMVWISESGKWFLRRVENYVLNALSLDIVDNVHSALKMRKFGMIEDLDRKPA